MNKRQITCLWIVLTLLCPTAYLLTTYLITTNSRITETYQEVWEPDSQLNHKHTYRIQDTNGAIYILKTDKADLTDTFIAKQIQMQHLQPLSSLQLGALDENQKLHNQKANVLKYSLIGLFITTSFTALYLYRAGRTNNINH